MQIFILKASSEKRLLPSSEIIILEMAAFANSRMVSCVRPPLYRDLGLLRGQPRQNPGLLLIFNPVVEFGEDLN